MYRPSMRLIDLFAHWRDEHLYELEAAISHLPAVEYLEVNELRRRRIATLSFQIDDQGRPQGLRRELDLAAVLRRYTGFKGQSTVQVAPLLNALRLERERRLRYLVHSAQASLLRLLDSVEMDRLYALPELATGPDSLVIEWLNDAGGQRGAGTLMEYPLTTLARVLSGNAAQRLLGLIVATLGWESEYPRETILGVQDLALLVLVLPRVLDPDGDFHSFDFYSETVTGLAIADLLDAMQHHIMLSLPNGPADAFGVVRFLLAAHCPAPLGVLGLPADMAWLSGGTFVLLSQGVNLAEAIAPGISECLSFDEALRLPGRLSETRPDPGLSTALAAAMVPGLMHWRQANQRIRLLPALPSLANAQHNFLQRLESLEKATSALERPMPMRIDMALRELEQRGIWPNMRFVEAADRERQSLFANAGVPALEAIITGEASGTAPVRVPALVRGHDGKLHERWCNAIDMPDMGARFEQAFADWKRDIGHAVGVMTRALIDDLPLKDRQRLEHHAVMVCQLARRTTPDAAPQSAPYGFVLYVATTEGVWYYTLLPWAGWCRVHASREAALPLPGAQWQLQPEQTLPFDWQAFSQGGAPQPGATFNGWLAPVASIKANSEPVYPAFRNATYIARQCASETEQYLGTLHTTALGTLTHADKDDQQAVEALKALVPFWSSIDTVKQGYEEGSSWMIALGLLGVACDLVTFGALGRVSALTLRFITLSLRQGTRKAAQGLIPRLRKAAQDALDSLIPVGIDPEAPAPLADNGLIASLRLTHRAVLQKAARRLRTLSDAPGMIGRPGPTRQDYLGRRVRHSEDDTPILVTAGHPQLHTSWGPRCVDAHSTYPYGPVLDVVDDTGRLGRLPLALPVTTIDALRYVPDPAPSLPKQWIHWGNETWLKCSGRFYRVQAATPGHAPLLVQARPPFERPSLKRSCRTPRQLPSLVCRASGERATEHFTELNADSVVSEGVVAWFDQRKIIPGPAGRFVDSGTLQEVRGGQVHVVRPVEWADYYSDIAAHIVTGNSVFIRLDIPEGIAAGVTDRRVLSAVRVKHIHSGQLHVVTCVDDGIYYHGIVPEGPGPLALRKLPAGNSPDPRALTEADELKVVYDGCWDANVHIRNRGLGTTEDHLEQVGQSIIRDGHRIDLSLLQRFALNTTPAQAAFFARYQRQSFTVQARRFAVGDYTYPLTEQTPEDVRAMIAKHLNRLTEPATLFDAHRVLDPAAIANAPPKGKNIAFLVLEHGENRPPSVYYSGSGGSRRQSQLALGKRLMGERRDPALPWQADDGTRYISCQGEGGKPGEEVLLHLPDLSKPGQLTKGDYNTRQLDSERNILAHLERTAENLSDVTQATLFTRFPTCGSCTTLISLYRERFPADRFRVYEGPLPVREGGEPAALPEQP
jgi:hypothetical protein